MAVLITGATKDALQSPRQRANVYASPLVPDTLWTAQIDNADIEIGEINIDFDNGAAGDFNDFSWIRGGQEVWIGTSAGDDDIGRGRVRTASSGDDGVTGTLGIAPNSFQLTDDLHLTFKLDFPIKPRYSYIDPEDETFYKDYDQAYTDQNSQPTPVVIAGPHRAGFIDEDSGEWVVGVDVTSSYAIADGATISSYGFEILPTTGHTNTFDTGTGQGDITFTTPGQYWVRYRVTDSNGKFQDSWRFYRAHDPDPTSEHYPLVDFTFSLNGSWENGGWQAGINARDGFALDELPDRTLVVVWQDSYYDGQQQVISRLPDSAPNLFTGYVLSSDDTYDLEEGIAQADFALVSPEGVLRNLYGFSLSLRATPDTVDEWYLYEEWLTTGRAVHHLLRWHTTVLLSTDVFNLTLSSLRRVGAMAQDGSIYDIIENLAMQQGVRQRLCGDHGGRLFLAPDVQLQPDATRAAYDVLMDIEKEDRSGPLTITRRQTPSAPFVTVSGISWDGTFEDGDETKPNVEAYCSQAPGAFAADGGADPASLDNQLFTSQDNANEIAGRLFGQVNNPIAEVSFNFHGNYVGLLEPLHAEFYTMTLQAGDTPRGVWTGEKNLILRDVSGEFDSETGLIRAHAAFEPEAEANDGVATECPGLPELGGFVDPDELPGVDALAGLATGASIHLQQLDGNWDERSTDSVNDLRKDPFWTTRQGSFDPDDAIMWSCGTGFVKRTEGAWATESDVTPAGPIDGVSVANIDFVMMDSNWSATGAFACIGRYEDGGEWTSWLFYTDDDGATWDHEELA